MASTKFTHAIVCRIPNSFKSKDIHLEKAKLQHENYVRLLRNIGLDVIELPPDESLPECVFVEDTAIVCNGIALITRPGNPARLKEVSLSTILKPKGCRLSSAQILGKCSISIGLLTSNIFTILIGGNKVSLAKCIVISGTLTFSLQ